MRRMISGIPLSAPRSASDAREADANQNLLMAAIEKDRAKRFWSFNQLLLRVAFFNRHGRRIRIASDGVHCQLN